MPSASAVFRNRRAEIARVAEFAERFGAEVRLSEDDVMAVNLVLDEVVANVIEHGYGGEEGERDIYVSMEFDGSLLILRVEDEGRPFDPLQAPPPDLSLPLEERPVGGLGIHIVRSLMDEVEYRRAAGRNVLIMRKTMGRS
jgi:serine/threonine-protein kinase RsbW/sigma-B regulation protein RsbU (phosphoserine phosphatase)